MRGDRCSLLGHLKAWDEKELERVDEMLRLIGRNTTDQGIAERLDFALPRRTRGAITAMVKRRRAVVLREQAADPPASEDPHKIPDDVAEALRGHIDKVSTVLIAFERRLASLTNDLREVNRELDQLEIIVNGNSKWP